ncbi:MAG: MFS transporter [candidate division KSB1 bacterium]|nr:MFS transporter [candidate division KSB1 bacterium]
MLKNKPHKAVFSPRTIFSLNPQGVLLGSVFFLFYFGLSAWLPFFNLYLKSRGFSGAQVGVVAGSYQAVLFFVVPIWGMLADRFGNKRLLMIVLFTAGLLIWNLRLIADYHLMIGYIILLAAMHHPLGTLSDSLAIGYVKHNPRAAFGQFRLWASLGWALGNLVMGRLLLSRSYTLMFSIAAAFYLAAWLLTDFFREQRSLSEPRSYKEAPRLFMQKQRIAFLLLLTLYGIAISPLYVFINLYYRDIGANNQIIGAAFAVQALSEVPFFLYGRALAARFGSGGLLVFSMVTAVGRLVLYGLIRHPLPALAVGLTSGITYSLFWIAIVDLMHDLTPEKYRSTAQSLLWAFHVGCGVTLGNLSIGLLSDYFHMQKIMLMAAALSAVVTVGMWTYLRRFNLLKRFRGPAIEVAELPHVVVQD